MAGGRYQRLDAQEIIRTIERLARRIEERFPEAGLAKVARELHGVAEGAHARTLELKHPNLLLRVGVGLLILSALLVLFVFIPEMRLNFQIRAISDLIQTVEALLGSLFFLGTGVAFLVTLEGRIKRRTALGVVHQLRALAHIVDMHQLTKDPEQLTSAGPTPSSPVRSMSDFELLRYLDYCSEMFALVSKVGALTVQGFADPVVLGAVDEVENLTTGLSRKIWQKIMIVQQLVNAPPRPRARDYGWRRGRA
ncbi:MAG: hypothetical protein KC776_02235 [Myxococcales bacterium]|nr:hypothetical protein [Myxococcales bacterium]MCB9582405.1 hypothetical protein [Polyangiaceae bacterium]